MSEYSSGTQSVWAGEEHLFDEGAICSPIYHSVAFGYDNMDDWFDVALGKKKGTSIPETLTRPCIFLKKNAHPGWR